MSETINWKQKLSSRKFWFCAAAFLGSLSVGITGAAFANQTIVEVGIWCGIISAAIYAACEVPVDVARVMADKTITQNTNNTSAAVNATTSNTATADKILSAGKVVEKVEETVKIGMTE